MRIILGRCSFRDTGMPRTNTKNRKQADTKESYQMVIMQNT